MSITTITHVKLGDVSDKFTEATVDIQTGLTPGGAPVDVISVTTFVAVDRSSDTIDALSRRAVEQALKSLQAAAKLSVDEIQASIKPRHSK